MLLFGIFAAVFGATMHVYFAVYWPAVCLVAYVHRQAVTHEEFSLPSLIRFANPGLVALGAGLYLLLAALTWLRGQPHFTYDPFEWLHRNGPLANFTDYSHTQFLDGSYATAAIFTGAAALGALLLPADFRGSTRRLQAPALLVLLALFLSLLLGWISYLVDYWILARQWVGSVALVAVGVVWFWAEAARVWARLTPRLGMAVCGVAALIVSGQALNIIGVRLAEVRTRLAESAAEPPQEVCAPPGALDLVNMSNEDRNAVMVDLANRNIACGGPIWAVFRGYYASQLAFRKK